MIKKTGPITLIAVLFSFFLVHQIFARTERKDEIDYLITELKKALPDKEPHVIEISASKRRGLSILKEAISDAIPDTIIW